MRFCLLFSLYTMLAFVALYALHTPFVVPFTKAIAWLTYIVARAVGARAWVGGQSVGVPGFSIQIANNCNAIYEIGLYAAAVMAYPAPFRRRVAGVLIGAGVLYVVNLVRVLTLLALGRYSHVVFQAAHLYVWQALFLVVVAACWFAWVSRVHRGA